MSPAQKRLVAKIEAGSDLIRSFDVYGGYWWWLRPTAEKIQKATVEALVRDGTLIPGENKRIYSGYQEMTYSLRSAPSAVVQIDGARARRELRQMLPCDTEPRE